jgi:hypothetical protein
MGVEANPKHKTRQRKNLKRVEAALVITVLPMEWLIMTITDGDD